ncbi:hypothetical protein N2W41_001766 [Clostridium perfringens]|nr:hypothetical protein [Clostridium perfringens]
MNFNSIFDFIKNSIYSVTADGWISLIGSIISFVGIFITIKFTKKQFEKDKRITIKPYLDIRFKILTEATSSLGFVNINKLKNINLYEVDDIGIEIGNLGQGNCLKCNLVGIKLNGKYIDNDLKYIGNIKVDESKVFEITFRTLYGDILEEFREKYIGSNIGDNYELFKENICRKTLNIIELQFEYKDVLDNKYSKSIVIETFIIFDFLTSKNPFEVGEIMFRYVHYEINDKLTNENFLEKS